MINILKRKIQLIIGRCVINTIKNNKYQIELLADETRDNIKIMQHFGYKSIPPIGTKGITLSIGGLRDDTIIIATENTTAPELKEGEQAIYNNFTEKVELKEGEANITGKIINLNGGNKQLVTHAELNTALQTMLTAINTHTHIYAPGPLPPVPTAPPVKPTTLDISSSKTTTINVE